MKGSSMGSLEVILQSGEFPYVDQVIWSDDQDRGDKWQYVAVNVVTDDQFHLIFQGTIGSSFNGDIAVDDVVTYLGEL